MEDKLIDSTIAEIEYIMNHFDISPIAQHKILAEINHIKAIPNASVAGIKKGIEMRLSNENNE
jgi:hypothetical protein